MKKIMTNKLFWPVAAIVTLIATAFVVVPSMVLFYQPKAPKCLNK